MYSIWRHKLRHTLIIKYLIKISKNIRRIFNNKQQDLPLSVIRDSEQNVNLDDSS